MRTWVFVVVPVLLVGYLCVVVWLTSPGRLLRDRRPRWYSHAMVKRYGWRTLYVNTPRIWKWGLHVCVLAFSTFGVGIVVFKDHEDDEWVALLQVLCVEVRVTVLRYWTNRQARVRDEEMLRARGEQLAEEVEDYLR